MEAIRKKIKRNGSDTITFKLPENFKAENLELIILPDDEEVISKAENEESAEQYKQRMKNFYDKFSFDIKNLRFDRDELNERR